MRKQWSDLNRVMRNPAPPLPDSSRKIKEQCIALMDETWGKIEEPLGGVTGYSYATASATNFSAHLPFYANDPRDEAP